MGLHTFYLQQSVNKQVEELETMIQVGVKNKRRAYKLVLCNPKRSHYITPSGFETA